MTQVLQTRALAADSLGIRTLTIESGETHSVSLSNDRTFKEPISKMTTFFMVAFHIGAIAALFMFSWSALAVSVLLLWVAGSLGVGMGYHRLLTHRGYKTYKWVEYLL